MGTSSVRTFSRPSGPATVGTQEQAWGIPSTARERPHTAGGGPLRPPQQQRRPLLRPLHSLPHAQGLEQPHRCQRFVAHEVMAHRYPCRRDDLFSSAHDRLPSQSLFLVSKARRTPPSITPPIVHFGTFSPFRCDFLPICTVALRASYSRAILTWCFECTEPKHYLCFAKSSCITALFCTRMANLFRYARSCDNERTNRIDMHVANACAHRAVTIMAISL